MQNYATSTGKHLSQSLFMMQFFRVIERQKVRAKHKFVNIYSATKKAHLYCKWGSFKFSISSFHLTLSWRRPLSRRNQSIDLRGMKELNLRHERVKPSLTLFSWDIHQFVFLTWTHLCNLSFSVQAGFNYRLHDSFQLVYMQWKFQFDLFKLCGNFSSVYCDEIFAYNRSSAIVVA